MNTTSYRLAGLVSGSAVFILSCAFAGLLQAHPQGEAAPPSAELLDESALERTVIQADPGPIPRYELVPGQVLHFQSDGEGDYTQQSMTYEAGTTVWVVRANEDGSRRLLLKSVSKRGWTYAGHEPVEPTLKVEWAWCDMQPDGRFAWNPTLDGAIDPTHWFPPLPAADDSIELGWSVENGRRGTTLELEKIADVQDCWEFRSRVRSPQNKIFLNSNSTLYHFDRNRKLIVESECLAAQSYGVRGRSRTHHKLCCINPVEDRADLDRMAEEASVFFEARQAYYDALPPVSTHPEEVSAACEEALALLTAVDGRVTHPEVRVLYDTAVADHPQTVSYALDYARGFEAIMGQATQPWIAAVLGEEEAREVSSASLEGKVVVLDFWYRGGGACIRAMPQLNRLADKYAEHDVEILGMNVDRSEGDALYVIEQMELRYPNLKAVGIPDKYAIRGFPTTVILDKQGVVREIAVGYRGDSVKRLSAKIDALLQE